MTPEKFKELLIRLGAEETSMEALSIVRVADFMAAQLWIERAPDNDDTRELRRQLVHLEEKGRFDYEPE